MTSKAEVFCRDRRLYDVRRGVVYLRRTDDLAQRQWRHYGAVPAIKTHVIRDVGVTAPVYDVTDSSPTADDSDISADQTLTDAGKNSDSDVISASPTDVREEPATPAVEEEIPVVQGRKRLRYRTRVLEEYAANQPLISITEVSESSKATTPAVTSRAPSQGPRVGGGGRGGRGEGGRGGGKGGGGGVTTSTTKPPQDQKESEQRTHGTSSLDTSKTSTDSSQHGVGSSSSPSLSHKPTHPRLGVSDSRLTNSTTSSIEFPSTTTAATTSKDFLYTIRESHGVPRDGGGGGGDDEGAGSPFNTWGSRDWDVEEKLGEDFKSRDYSPKRYPPQSRVSGHGVGVGEGGGLGARRRKRQLRTLTDFRSRNGTVRIIRPLASVTDSRKVAARPGGLHRRQPGLQGDNQEEEDFDLEQLAREKTYAMLKRIDRLLEPSKAYFTSDLNSSERETGSSSTPTTSCGFDQSLSDFDFDDDIEGEEERWGKGGEGGGEEGREDKVGESREEEDASLSLRARAERRRVRQQSGDEHDATYSRAAVNLSTFYGRSSHAKELAPLKDYASFPVHAQGRFHQHQDPNRGQSEYYNLGSQRGAGGGGGLQGVELASHVHSGFRGHSEPPRVSGDFRYRQNLIHGGGRSHKVSSSPNQLVVPTADPQLDMLNVFYPRDSAAFPSMARSQHIKAGAATSRLPPLQQHHQHHHLGASIERLDKSENLQGHLHEGQGHSHGYQGDKGSRRTLMEARGKGVVGTGGKGVVGAGGKTLGEVIARLENQGVDLHHKCQQWINKCSAHFNTSQTAA